MTFRRFMEEGFGGDRATLADFDRHLTTLFPDVRLKHIIEVRGADAVPSGLTCSLPALWKGILYHPAAREAATALLAGVGDAERAAAQEDVARRGLGARIADRSVLELARELTGISRAGLREIAHSGRRDADETSFLDPVAEQLELGESPGSVILRQWDGEWAGSVDRLIAYARY
jgi:glutamate--cysteine ligase